MQLNNLHQEYRVEALIVKALDLGSWIRTVELSLTSCCNFLHLETLSETRFASKDSTTCKSVISIIREVLMHENVLQVLIYWVGRIEKNCIGTVEESFFP